EAAAAPRAPEAFLGWFAALKENGPGQGDPLHPWLAQHATWPQLRWFLHQEVAGEAGFDDLVAMTQVKLPERAKLEMARNYWDEMGRGTVETMHGRMLRLLAVHLDLKPTVEDTVWESLTLSNLMMGLAANRRYAWHSVGALGVIELTAPTRVGHVDAALMRHGFSADLRRYFTVHSVLDVKHSQAWNAEVIAPAVARDPEVATAIAEGALMRLHAGARCFARYRAELGAPG
ncbi:MAG TPA: iron-containing redox enzyme family protein, partial [Planctomycetota bacterium]|nr:iron-containing redox enzyme family protein [Planctomycetota bacterium]